MLHDFLGRLFEADGDKSGGGSDFVGDTQEMHGVLYLCCGQRLEKMERLVWHGFFLVASVPRLSFYHYGTFSIPNPLKEDAGVWWVSHATTIAVRQMQRNN